MDRVMVPVMLVLFGMAPAAFATSPVTQGSSYIGGQFVQLAYDEEGVPDDANPRAAVGRLGHFIANRVAVEGRLGVGVRDDTVPVPDGSGGFIDIDLALDSLYGAYVLGHVPLGTVVSIYGVVGFTEAQATASVNMISVSQRDNGFSYGGGIEIHPTSELGINVEYMQYLDKGSYDLSAVAIGATLYF